MALVAQQRWPTLLFGAGIGLCLLLIGEVVAAATEIVDAPDGFLGGVASGVPVLLGFVYGVHWLRTSSLPPERYQRVAVWCLSGAAGFAALVTMINLLIQPATAFLVVTTARWGASLGGAIGLFAGIRGAQTIEQQIARRQAAVRAEELEKRQELLEFLNALLRHEVLNAMTATTNYAELLDRDADLDEKAGEYVERIHEQSQSTADVISEVRVLVETLDQSTSVEPVDLCETLAGTVREVRESYPAAQVELDCPDGVLVAGDDSLARVFVNLLENGIYHNDTDPPRVTVAVSAGSDPVEVRVADNGPGVPERKQETLFDPEPPTGADHGLGLYLARTVAKSYGGSLELRETGPEGSVFVVSLPRTEDCPTA